MVLDDSDNKRGLTHCHRMHWLLFSFTATAVLYVAYHATDRTRHAFVYINRSTIGTTKAVLSAILSMGWCIKTPHLSANRKE